MISLLGCNVRDPDVMMQFLSCNSASFNSEKEKPLSHSFDEFVYVKSNQSNVILFVTCAEYNGCRLYYEMLTYESFPNNEELRSKNHLLKKK